VKHESEIDELGRRVHLAGAIVPAGRYRRVDSSTIIEIEDESVLPAALDGRSTSYTRASPWSDTEASVQP
jgi:hypothetical protein